MIDTLKIDIINRIKRQLKHMYYLKAENAFKNQSITRGLTVNGAIIEKRLNAKIEA